MMFRLLLRLRFRALFFSLFAQGRKKKSLWVTVLMGLLFLYLGGCFLFAFSALFAALGLSVLEGDGAWSYFALASIIAAVLMLLGSVIFTKNQLYDADDNQILLAFPIPPRTILLSRLAFLLLLNYLLEAVVMLPALVFFLLLGSPSFLSVLFTAILLLVFPVIPLALSALLAWVIAKISSMIRRKNLLTLMISLLILAAYFFFLFGFEDTLLGMEEDAFLSLPEALKNTAIFRLFGEATVGKALPFLLYLLLTAAVGGATLYVLSRTFLRIALTPKKGKKQAYRERTLEKKPVIISLLKRELLRIWSSAGYMMNAGIGLVFFPVLPIYLLVSKEAKDALLGFFPSPDFPAVLAVLVLLALSATVTFSASSVSLEGKHLWILRSSPVPTKDILLAKVLAHFIPTATMALLSSILFLIVLTPDALTATLLLLVPLLFSLTSSLLGLAANLLLPKLEWKNEMVPVKQGMAVLVAMLVTGILACLLGTLTFLLSLLLPVSLSLLVLLVAVGGLTFLLYWFISRTGVRYFEKL